MLRSSAAAVSIARRDEPDCGAPHVDTRTIVSLYGGYRVGSAVGRLLQRLGCTPAFGREPADANGKVRPISHSRAPTPHPP
jgi:hypothetical protein